MDTASKATLENEFGTHNDEEVIKLILEKGTLQETEVRISLPHPHPPYLSFPCPSNPPVPTQMLTPSPHRPQRDKEPRTTAWVPELHTREAGSMIGIGA
jgi:hypothetical protein